MKQRFKYPVLIAWMALLPLEGIHAQRITHNFRNTSMSEVLIFLAKNTKDCHINFMYVSDEGDKNVSLWNSTHWTPMRKVAAIAA